MAGGRYCDRCGELLGGEPVVLAQRPVPAPGGRMVPGPTRSFHARCLPRAAGYLSVEDSERPPSGTG